MLRRPSRLALAFALVASGCYDGAALDALLAAGDEGEEGSTTGAGSSSTGAEASGGDEEGTSEGSTSAGEVGAAPAIAAFTVDGSSAPAPIDSARAVSVAVAVADAAAVSRVEIHDGEALVAALVSPPFSMEWLVDDVVASSPRALRAVAFGPGGEASAPALVPVSFSLPDGGTPRWMAEAEAEAGDGAVVAVAIAADGDVVTMGERRVDAVTSQMVLVRRDPGDGAIRWERRFPSTPIAGERRVGRALAIAEDGALVVGGALVSAGEGARLYAALHEGDGALREGYVGAMGESLRDVAAVPGGDVVVVGSVGASEVLAGESGWDEGGEVLVRRYRAGWSTRWSTSAVEGLDEIWSSGQAVEVTSDGSVVVAGTYGADDASPRAFVARFGHDGAPLWAQVDLPPGLASDRAAGLTLNRRGEAVVVATARVAGDPYSRVEIRRLRALDGALLSVDALVGGVGDEVAGGVVVDRHDRLHVVATRVDGEGRRDVGISKLSSDGGAVLWARTHGGGPGGEALGAAVAVDSLGYVYVGGTEAGASGSRAWSGAFHP